MSIEVVPAILPESFDDIAAKASLVKGLVDRVQIDIANGTFAKTKTWPFEGKGEFMQLVSQEEGLPFWEDIDYEVDMLIKDPEKEIDEWLMAGVSAAIIHLGTTDAIADLSEQLRDQEVECGIGILPKTNLEDLFEVIDYADFVQVMGNNDIGHHGKPLDPKVFEKVREIRKEFPLLPIAVDIGVNEETAERLVEAGATKLVSGSAIFGSEDIPETISYLRDLE